MLPNGVTRPQWVKPCYLFIIHFFPFLDEPLHLWARPLFSIRAPHSRRRESILDKECHLTLILTNHAPQPVTIDTLYLVMTGPTSGPKEDSPERKPRTISTSSVVSTGEEPTGKECYIDGLAQDGVNSLAPGICSCIRQLVIIRPVSKLDALPDVSISCEIALGWMPKKLTFYKSTLVQVMAWYHQATSLYLSQSQPRSMSPYGFTGPQYVNYLQCISNGVTAVLC